MRPYHVRLYIASNIVISCIDATKAHLHRHTLKCTVIQRHPVHVRIVVVLVFRVAHDGVVAELIV